MAVQASVPTILNNVMGPIGMGPSTSNTCGPCRIGYLASKLLRAPLRQAVIRFPVDSGYATPNCQGMRSDYAFAHGLLGRLPDSPEPLLGAFDKLKEQRIELTFQIDEALHSHEHLLSILELTDDDGETVEVWGISKGGGIVELTKVNGFSLSLGGDGNTFLVFSREQDPQALEQLADKLIQRYPQLGEYPHSISTKDGGGLLLFSTYHPVDQATAQELLAEEGIHKTAVLPAVLPVVVRPCPSLPFSSAASLERYCCDAGRSLREAALEYEAAASGWTPEQILSKVRNVLRVMRQSVQEGLRPGLTFDGIAQPAAARLMDRYPSASLLGDGITTKAAIYSLAIMEYSNASGVVVCMPTAGASGTIAAALLAAAEQLSSSDDQLVDALLSAGAVGVSITKDNDFCGGVHGCQAEVGCASAMAAAGLVTLMGGGAKEALAAASMALQNMLGLICDPVCGLVQVPCFARNMSGIANAVVSANLCMLGFDPVIPLQDAFEAMKTSGNLLPTCLKGCGGGLCETAAGRDLLQQYTRDLQARAKK